jgi:glutamate dehydrogenase (NAD(P)+)
MKGFVVQESTFRLVHGAEGYVVIDSLRRETSAGGVRISPDMTLDEVRALAREMSFKFGFFDLPRGGAKSGIRMPAGLADEGRREVLENFGAALKPLIAGGRYYPGMDMNCGPRDLQAIYRGAGREIGRFTDTSLFTALSAAHALLACRETMFPEDRTLTVAVEGFGSVGAWLARRLPQEAFRITAVSTVAGAVADERGFNPETLVELREEYGDALVEHLPGTGIEKRELLTQPVDILIPSARTWSIDTEIATRLRASCVVPVANVPYAEGSVEILHERGVLCLPGFVCNGGGVFASSLADSGVAAVSIESICRDIYQPLVGELIRRSNALGISPVNFAQQIAGRRLERGEGGRIGHLLKKAYHRGLFPAQLYGFVVRHLFGRNLIALERLIQGQPLKG